MARPLVIAYHLIWTAYGWWLPNDPRGSGSRQVASETIAELGDVHFGRKSVQPSGKSVREFYERAADILKFPLLAFDESDFAIVASAFAEVIADRNYTCYACAIMPDHVHILIRKHRDTVEEMATALMERSREALMRTDRRSKDHPTWTGGTGWSVFLEHPKEIRRTIPYIERNPEKIRLPRQHWSFVKEYDDWPLHKGHSPNSPYVKRLRVLGQYP